MKKNDGGATPGGEGWVESGGTPPHLSLVYKREVFHQIRY